ncbi:MAG: alpha/beta hydrolase [Leptolyngbya sp. Prado105]|jgi:pimeloyl-ACP methyl ester carboxylesterase|nr:alpha/beta hydrolase [Leptolyngbya sp. Prado105]
MIQSSPCFLTPKSLRPQFPLFVFLPGMDGTGQLLRSQTGGLEKGFDVRCLAIPPDDLTNWEALAQRVVDLVKAEVDVKRSIYLCGESFGGCLAMKVVEHAPELFDRLILVNPASSFNRRPWIGWGAQISQHLPEIAYQWSSVSLLPLLAAFQRILPLDRQALITAVRSVPQPTSVWRMNLLQEFEIPMQALRSLETPTLILASAKDRLLPSLTEAYRLKANLQQADVVVLPESGHTCLLEQDVNLYQILAQGGFLQETLS